MELNSMLSTGCTGNPVLARAKMKEQRISQMWQYAGKWIFIMC